MTTKTRKRQSTPPPSRSRNGGEPEQPPQQELPKVMWEIDPLIANVLGHALQSCPWNNMQQAEAGRRALQSLSELMNAEAAKEKKRLQRK